MRRIQWACCFEADMHPHSILAAVDLERQIIIGVIKSQHWGFADLTLDFLYNCFLYSCSSVCSHSSPLRVSFLKRSRSLAKLGGKSGQVLYRATKLLNAGHIGRGWHTLNCLHFTRVEFNAVFRDKGPMN